MSKQLYLTKLRGRNGLTAESAIDALFVIIVQQFALVDEKRSWFLLLLPGRWIPFSRFFARSDRNDLPGGAAYGRTGLGIALR